MSAQIIFEKKLPRGTFQTFNNKPLFPLNEVKQVHGNKVVAASNELIEADGLYAMTEHYSLAIKTADCLPIVVIGKNGVALLDAGWKGVKSAIFCQSKVIALEPFYFFLGPGIRHYNYEVQEDFLQNFKNSEYIIQQQGQFFFDLYGEAKARIQTAFPQALIEELESPCTFASSNFHSYRRDKTALRNWNILKSEL